MALERYVLERNQEVDASDLRPGQYTQFTSGTREGANGWCVVSCPKCGTLAVILRNVHSVSWIGDVSPGVTCPNTKKCTLAATVYLDGWVPEAKGQA